MFSRISTVAAVAVMVLLLSGVAIAETGLFETPTVEPAVDMATDVSTDSSGSLVDDSTDNVSNGLDASLTGTRGMDSGSDGLPGAMDDTDDDSDESSHYADDTDDDSDDSLDDVDDESDESSRMVGTIGEQVEYQAAAAGFVWITFDGYFLALDDVDVNEGWYVVKPDVKGDQIQLEFHNCDTKVEFKAETDDGRVKLEVKSSPDGYEEYCTAALPMPAASVEYQAAAAGFVWITFDGYFLALDDIDVNEGWYVVKQDVKGDQIQLELHDGHTKVEFKAETDDGRVKLEVKSNPDD